MTMRVGSIVAFCAWLLGCGGGEDAETTTTSPTAATIADGDDDGSSDGGEETTGPAEGSTSSTPETTSGPDPDTSTGPGEESGTTGPTNFCDPVVPGEWNACQDAQGNIDNTLCNWMGSGDATGFIGCLTSSMTEGANVCFISGCKDVCDCFAPPTTGTAEVICDAILDGGGMGCGLSCSGNRTCPDGMECLGELCFWPAAG